MSRPFDTVQDELLVLAAQAGDVDAFEALVRRWLPVMRRHAARLTGDPAGAEDVVQDSCLAICAGLRRIDDPATAPGWMLRIVTHKAADWVRRRRRDRDLARAPQNLEPRPTPSDPSHGTDAMHRTAAIRAACMSLPEELRAVVSLYYGEGLPIAAVAAGTGTPEGTVKSRLHEARRQLKSILERNPS